MFQRMLTGALFAGAAAGLIAALLHFAFVQQVILLGEQYESGELVHFQNAMPAPDGHAHDHGDDHAHDEGHADGAAQAHGAAGSDLQRNALTVAFTVLIYVSYAVMLFAGFGLAESTGRRIDAQTGLLWGLTGFAAFQLAPAMGLPPELPGTVAADLAERQVWWWMTVGLTAGGISLLAYGRKVWMFVLAGAALAARSGGASRGGAARCPQAASSAARARDFRVFGRRGAIIITPLAHVRRQAGTQAPHTRGRGALYAFPRPPHLYFCVGPRQPATCAFNSSRRRCRTGSV